MEKFFQRISYKGKLEDIGVAVAERYGFGDSLFCKLVPAGYEDFNFVLETTKDKHFVKVFANFRTKQQCLRYIEVMVRAENEGVSIPKLLQADREYFYSVIVNDSPLRLCVMQYIDGDTYYDLKRKPNAKEIQSLAQQAARINSIDLKPKFEYDSWAIVNFLNEFQHKSRSLRQEERELVEPLVEEYKKIDFEKLPQAFVHGDLIATNVIKDKDNRDWMIDFAVANTYPRIQEIAVLASNLLFDERSKERSTANLELALREYQATIKLTPEELNALPGYIKLAHGMHVLAAGYEKMAQSNSSEENEYWLNQGTIGLTQTLKRF
ncbi:phosphotransferase [Patescibacteria group bacterium]|nr:phosphotransferase [Patescibacteria group bacterium]